ncbi:hypothetical protein ACFLTE_06280 [Bacteroidota bacterium]
MKNILLIVILLMSMNISSFSQTDSVETQKGKSLNFEITTGLQGSLSFFQIGINLPQFIDHFVIGIKFREMSSLTWATFINEQTKESVSFHPVVLGGVICFGGTNDLVLNTFRQYGACEILMGYSFTPYDNMIYNTGNLIGSNTTFGIFGTYGLEFFTKNKLSVYIESGGGFKTIKGDKDNQYVIASSWLGSGITFRMGAKIYFK